VTLWVGWCWKWTRGVNNMFCILLVLESFLVWLSTWCNYLNAILMLHSVFLNVLFLLDVTDYFHRIYRCTILVTKWLHFQTSACLIWAPYEILIWTRAHIRKFRTAWLCVSLLCLMLRKSIRTAINDDNLLQRCSNSSSRAGCGSQDVWLWFVPSCVFYQKIFRTNIYAWPQSENEVQMYCMVIINTVDTKTRIID
jgi:hypothetical protein